MIHITKLFTAPENNLSSCGLKDVNMGWTTYSLVTCINCLEEELNIFRDGRMPKSFIEAHVKNIKDRIKELKFNDELKEVIYKTN